MTTDSDAMKDLSENGRHAGAPRVRTLLHPCHFGAAGRRLFGVYEGPADDTPAHRGVVLCYPHGRDYVAAFRAFRVLATRLSAAGFRVLRFDYAGTGDSWGETEDGSLHQWTDDIVSAVDWLRTSHHVVDLALVGLRLGATLAAFAGIDCQRVDRVVLWEPILDGRAEVADMTARHQAWLDAEVRERRGARALAGADELLGYRFTPRLRAELEGVSLAALPKAPAPRVRIMTGDLTPAHTGVARHLEELGSRVETAVCATVPKIWGTNPGMEQGLVPAEALQSIVRSLQVVHP